MQRNKKLFWGAFVLSLVGSQMLFWCIRQIMP